MNKRFSVNVILAILLFATLSRFALLPFSGHVPNFSAIDATALFCGAYFSRSWLACAITLLAVWVGDFFLNQILTGSWNLFYSGFYWQYGSYLLITLLGRTLKDKTPPLSIASASLTSALVFFGISNFGVWYSGLLYPANFAGLLACYVAALPFFKNTLLSDLFFTFLLFGIFKLSQTSAAQAWLRRDKGFLPSRSAIQRPTATNF